VNKTEVVKLETNVIYNEDCLIGMKKLPDNSIDLVLTDPPYPFNTSNGTDRFTENGWFEGSSDKYDEEWYKDFETKLKEIKRVLKPGRHFYCFVDEKNLFLMKPYLDKYFEFKKVIVWHKVNMGLGYHYRNVIEYCFLYSNGKSQRFIKNQPNFYQAPKDNIDGHPTVKSCSMFEWLIKNSSDKGELVLDPYIGSGTTAVASLRTGRKFIGFEIDKEYFKLAITRLSKFDKKYLNALPEEEQPAQLQMF